VSGRMERSEFEEKMKAVVDVVAGNSQSPRTDCVHLRPRAYADGSSMYECAKLGLIVGEYSGLASDWEWGCVADCKWYEKNTRRTQQRENSHA